MITPVPQPDIAPEREDERLHRLYAQHLLDTPREADFDQIADLAAAICEAPVALVSLVDRDRQWFKAASGLEAEETPRSQSVCAHTMWGDAVLEIPDTRVDPRTRDNPLVCDGVTDMKFYAGAPLVTSDGARLGALCVLDRKPRRLSPVQHQALRTLAAQVITQIELRRALRESEEAKARLQEAACLHDVLEREMDHRVRNSLQQVSSFLRLQAARAGDGPVRAALSEAQRRVAAVAGIHAALHDSGSRETVPMQSYFARLAANLNEALPEGVELSMAAGDLALPTKKASAIAVIANEFIANSIKYAFTEGRQGRIEVHLVVEDGALVASFSDDGVGMEPGVAAGGTGLGMRIIEASVQQIGGEFRVLAGPGTRMEMRAPI